MKSDHGIIRFGDFTLDPQNRKLLQNGNAVELGGRYLDTLIMLASTPGQLVSKNRLHEEVWRGVPVTDEALSQAIKSIRRALGDDAKGPRYIETVPRHGYRFVGTTNEGTIADSNKDPNSPILPIVTGGVLGALAAGIAVGLIYGFLSATSAPGNALSLLLVLIFVSTLSSLVAGMGISTGVAFGFERRGARRWLPILAGAGAGVMTGALARLVGLDTLRLLVGSAPDRIAGAPEGLLMGAIVGASAVVLGENRHMWRLGAVAGLGAAGGLALVSTGGTLMAGSLAALVSRFSGADLTMAWVRDPVLIAVSGGLEGALFTVLVAYGLSSKSRA